MSTAIAYALGAMGCFGVADFLYKRGALAGVKTHQFLMVQTWFFIPSVVFYGLLTGTLAFVPGSLWGAAAGFFLFIGFYNFARSLRHGSVSVNAPIFRLSLVITVVLAIALLTEPMTFFKIAGIAAAMLAVWLLLGGRGSTEGRTAVTRESLLAVIIAMTAVGIGNFIHKLGLSAGATPASLIVAQGAVVSSLATGFSAAVDGGVRPSALAFRHAPVAAVALALGFAFMVEGLSRGEASVVVPIAQIGFVVTAFIGIVFLNEQLTTRKGMGLTVAVLALLSLAHG